LKQATANDPTPSSVGSGADRKYLIYTFGCQMNEHDTEVLAGILESIGYTAATGPAEADLVVINTCAVRRKPEEKVAGLLGKLKPLKQAKREMLIAVGGCMTQQAEAAAYIQKRFRHVSLVFGTHSLPRFPALLEQARFSRETVVDIEGGLADRDGLPIRRAGIFKAWLPVIYGCNNFCSYCVVPYVRGRERSRPLAEILKEARSLAAQGYREVTLLGQNVNSYGLDRPEGHDFAGLLLELDKIAGLARIRFMTSHPKDLSPRLIEAVGRGEKICEHFHLPVQSGSNRILELMNRRYTRERYLELLHSIRESVPGVAVTTDLIVGFPGETEDDFTRTLDLVQQARFDNAFTFIYSRRAGTGAAAMDDSLPRQAKETRLQRLAQIQSRISLEINRTLEGGTLEVMGEGPSKSDAAMQTGRTRSNKLVHFAGSENSAGKLFEVQIAEARTWHLIGEKV
jgi:tRNA-2-methylthio-N6-dimethylallyladenosine synthase